MEIEPYQRRQENKFVHLTRPSCSKFKILASSSFVEKINAIETKNLTKIYNNNFTAVNSLNLEIPDKTIFLENGFVSRPYALWGQTPHGYRLSE